ncbi:hypothetical protein BJY01DRAFT_78302 [Aspergillus pseudoustus]|uniref:Helicase ATP-binding domain-containing protein n=1 Tax=Aspergillus pseudoustus TaxID=1810923 RepID=A0ABR4KLS6_9EURO
MAKRISSQAKLLPKRKRRRVTNKPPSRTRSGARRSTTSLAVQHGEDNAREHIGSIQPSPQVATADTLIPVGVKVHWVRNRGNIDDTLQAAIENGIDIPDHNMDFTHDPRLLESIFAFKDIIKRMYKCQEISMDIQSLRLKHDSSDGEIETDILTRPWEKTLEIFNDRNLAYYVSVVFEPVDDVEANLWESLVPQPELHSFFDVQESGLSLNTTQILERTVELPEYQDFLDETEDDQAVDEIGTAPEPKTFDSKEAQIQYYGGYDANTEDGRRRWQNRLLANLSCNGKAARVKLNKLPVELNDFQKTSVTIVQEQMHRIAIEKEACTNTTKRLVSESEYCVLQRAFSGTDYRSGPPVDLCLRLLLATKQDNGLYRSELLEEFVDSDFYHYQISGAVGIIAKLYGQIDANKLLLATDCLQHPQADVVREAAAQLKDFCLHGAILADETGFGKTKQSLLAAVLHTFLYTEKDEDRNDCHRPILLVVPPTLIRQWLVEIRDHWPHLIPVLSYGDTTFRMDMDLSTLSYQAMREVPKLTAIPERLRYIFDMRDEEARQVIIITSYATHRFRAGHSEEHHVPPVSHDPPQYNPETKQEIYKVRPRLQLIWASPHKGKYSLLIADEAQKVKNPETYTWQVLRVHEMPKTLLMTATPMFNAALVRRKI